MAAKTWGSQNQPHFADGDAPDFAVDLTQASDYAALVGNRKVGTNAQRVALTGADVWDGLEFFETDTRGVFLHNGGDWFFGSPVMLASAVGPSGQTDCGTTETTVVQSTFTAVAGGIYEAVGSIAFQQALQITQPGSSIVRLKVDDNEWGRVAGGSTTTYAVGATIAGSVVVNLTGLGAGSHTIAITAVDLTGGGAIRCLTNGLSLSVKRIA